MLLIKGHSSAAKAILSRFPSSVGRTEHHGTLPLRDGPNDPCMAAETQQLAVRMSRAVRPLISIARPRFALGPQRVDRQRPMGRQKTKLGTNANCHLVFDSPARKHFPVSDYFTFFIHWFCCSLSESYLLPPE